MSPLNTIQLSSRVRALVFALPAIFSAGLSQAGTLFHDYAATPADGTVMNNAVAGVTVVTGGRLRLLQSGIGNARVGVRFPDLDAGKEVAEFTVEFDLTMFASGQPADGFALNFGSSPTGAGDLITVPPNNGEDGFAAANNLNIVFDTYDNGGAEAPAIEAKANGGLVKGVYMGNSAAPGGSWGGPAVGGTYPFDNVTRHVVFHWEANTGLDVRITGSSGAMVDVMTDIALPGFVPGVGNVFSWSGRTGGATEDIFIDNFSIVTVPVVPIETGGPSLSEFVVDNGTPEDEDCQTGAWLEIYNGQSTPQTFTGWYLTDDVAIPTKWAIPSGFTLGAYSYVRIWADGKNRTASSLNYHTNFILNPLGGYLALIKPDLSPATAYTYGPQSKDVAFGRLGAAQTLGYLETPTPGVKNSGLQAALPPCKQDVTFSHVGGLLTAPLLLTLTPPTVVGAVARYTTDNSVPNSSSPLWPVGGLNVTGSSNIRVRYFQPNALGGDVSSRTFIFLDASLTNYRGSGQPFSSNLPIVVMDSFGINIDNAGGSPGLRPYRSTYTVALGLDPLNSNKAVITGPIDMQNRGGVHLRGETSAGFAQRPYGLEIWDNKEQDKSVNLLGWPAESDFIFISNYNDKAVVRNMMPFDMRRQLGGEGSAMKEMYVEVFFKQDGAGALSYNDYRGIYILTEKIKRDKDRVNIEELKPCDGVFTNNPAVDDAGIISGGYIIRKDKASPETAFTTTGGTAAGTTYAAQSLQMVEPNNPSTAQLNYIRGYMNRMEAALYSAAFADPATGYPKYLDVPSWIDGHLWVEIFKQIDGYRLSTYMYKDRFGKLKYSPLWDYNLCTGNGSPAGGYAATLEQPTAWYYTQLGNGDNPYHPRLFQDPLFLRQYWDRYWQLRRTMFSNANVIATIDRYIAQLKNAPAGATTLITNGGAAWPASVPTLDVPIGRHHARWQRLGIYDWPNATNPNLRTAWETNFDPNAFTPTSDPFTTVSETAFVKTWMLRRLAWMDDQSTSYGGSVRNQKPPSFSNYGGEVPSGFVLSIGDFGASPTTIYYTTDGSDPALGGGTALTSTGSSPLTYTILPENGAVTYLVPSTTNGGSTLDRTQGGANQWNGIASPPNLANWSSGTFGLGYDYNDTIPPIATDVLFGPYIGTDVKSLMHGGTAAPPNNASIYTRSNFTLTAQQIADMVALKLNVRYDDSYIAYINGVEVARKLYPALPTQPSYNTASGQVHADASAINFEEVDLFTFKSQLVAGTNVIAFHGMNASVSISSASGKDFLLQPKLTASQPASLTYAGTYNITSTTLVRARSKDSGNNWSPITEANFIVNAVPATAANVVVSKLSYNPLPPTPAEITASGANNANDFEYLEIMNIGNQTVDLTGCYFDLGITFNWASAPISKQTLGPNQRMVLVENPLAFNVRYGVHNANVAGAFLGNMANGGETITFRAANGNIIKSFTYDDVEPWPVDADLDLNALNQVLRGGYALVLNNPKTNPDHNVGTNWRSSVGLGGKPGSGEAAGSPPIPDGDADGDGILDIVEYAIGSPQGNGDQSRLPQLGWADFNTGVAVETCLSLQFIRNLDADNVTVTPQVSTDLGGWQAGTVALTYVGTQNNGNGTATVTYRSTAPAGTLPNRLFAKLLVTSIP